MLNIFGHMENGQRKWRAEEKHINQSNTTSNKEKDAYECASYKSFLLFSHSFERNFHKSNHITRKTSKLGYENILQMRKSNSSSDLKLKHNIMPVSMFLDWKSVCRYW